MEFVLETQEFRSWRCQISIPPKKFADKKRTSFTYFAFLKVYLVAWLLFGFHLSVQCFQFPVLEGLTGSQGWGQHHVLEACGHHFRLFDQNPDLSPLYNHKWQRSRFSKEGFTSLIPIYSGFTSSELNCKFWGFGRGVLLTLSFILLNTSSCHPSQYFFTKFCFQEYFLVTLLWLHCVVWFFTFSYVSQHTATKLGKPCF